METVLETIFNDYAAYGTSFLKDFTQNIHIGKYLQTQAVSDFLSYFLSRLFFAMILRKSTVPHRDNIKSLVVEFYS